MNRRGIGVREKELDRKWTALLMDAADKARARAYCPYSKFAVGAAVVSTDGRIFSGCNVENASFGLSMCAERNAIAAAVAAGVKAGEIEMAAVIGGPLDAAELKKHFTKAGKLRPLDPLTPCGACRQVLYEFAAENMPISCDLVFGLPGEDGWSGYIAGELYSIYSLLPDAFHLP